MGSFEDDRERSVPIPSSFFDHHLSRIRDLAAMKVLLTLYLHLRDLDPNAPFVSEEEIFADRQLVNGVRMAGSNREPVDEIRRGIDVLAAHDAIVRIVVEEDGAESYWLMPKSPNNQRILSVFASGSRAFPYRQARTQTKARVAIERPNAFRLFEQNVGVVTPLIADQIIEAIEIYPAGWIEDAINEAVSLNRRNWRYIQRILERWSTEGRGDEAYRRNQSSSGFVEPEKYLRGKYSSLFKRGR